MAFVHDALPCEAGFLEIEQDGEIEASDVEISDHLRDVRLVEGSHDLWIDDDLAVHDEIGNELAD